MRTKLNIELFKKMRDRIAEIPESYDQTAWVVENEDAPCGTAACLAGEAIICAAPDVATGIRRLRRLDGAPNGHAVPERAAKLLRLPHPTWGTPFGDASDNETARLFRCNRNMNTADRRPSVFWPAPFGPRFNRAKTNRTRAKVAVAYLDHIIATGKVDE